MSPSLACSASTVGDCCGLPNVVLRGIVVPHRVGGMAGHFENVSQCSIAPGSGAERVVRDRDELAELFEQTKRLGEAVVLRIDVVGHQAASRFLCWSRLKMARRISGLRWTFSWLHSSPTSMES